MVSGVLVVLMTLKMSAILDVLEKFVVSRVLVKFKVPTVMEKFVVSTVMTFVVSTVLEKFVMSTLLAVLGKSGVGSVNKVCISVILGVVVVKLVFALLDVAASSLLVLGELVVLLTVVS